MASIKSSSILLSHLQLFVFLLMVSSLFSKSLQQQPMALAVQGYISCKSCVQGQNPTSKAGEPLPGAVAKLECNKYGISAVGTTDSNGNFYIQPQTPLPDYFNPEFCRVWLVSSRSTTCQKAVVAAAHLRKGYVRVEGSVQTLHYITGLLQFGPSSSCKRPK